MKKRTKSKASASRKPPNIVVTATNVQGMTPEGMNTTIKHLMGPILRSNTMHAAVEICNNKLPTEKRVEGMCVLKDMLTQSRVACGMSGSGAHNCPREEQEKTKQQAGFCMGTICTETLAHDVDYVDLITNVSLLEAKFEVGSTGALLCVMLLRDIVFFLEHYILCAAAEDCENNEKSQPPPSQPERRDDDDDDYVFPNPEHMPGDVLCYGEVEGQDPAKLLRQSEVCTNELARVLHRNFVYCTEVADRGGEALSEVLGRFVAAAECSNLINSISDSVWQAQVVDGSIDLQLQFLLKHFPREIDATARTRVDCAEYIDWCVVPNKAGPSKSPDKRVIHVTHNMRGAGQNHMMGTLLASAGMTIVLRVSHAPCMPFVCRARSVACGMRSSPDICSQALTEVVRSMMKIEHSIIMRLTCDNHIDILKYAPYLQRLRGVFAQFTLRMEVNVRMRRLCMCVLEKIHEFDRLDLPTLLPPEYAAACAAPPGIGGGGGDDDDDEINQPAFLEVATRDMLMPRVFSGGGPDDRDTREKFRETFLRQQVELHYSSFAMIARKLERLAEYLNSEAGASTPPPAHLEIDHMMVRWMLQTAMELDAELIKDPLPKAKCLAEEGLIEISFSGKKPCLIMEGLVALAASGGTRGVMYFWRAKALHILVDIVRLGTTSVMRMYASWILTHMLTRGPDWELADPKVTRPVLDLLFEPKTGVLDQSAGPAMEWGDVARSHILIGSLWNALMVLEACRGQSRLDFRGDGLTEEARSCNALNAIPRLYPLTKLEDVPGHPYNDVVCAIRGEVRVLAARIAYVHLYDFSALNRRKGGGGCGNTPGGCQHSQHPEAEGEEEEEDSEEGRQLHSVD